MNLFTCKNQFSHILNLRSETQLIYFRALTCRNACPPFSVDPKTFLHTLPDFPHSDVTAYKYGTSG